MDDFDYDDILEFGMSTDELTLKIMDHISYYEMNPDEYIKIVKKVRKELFDR